MDPPLGNNPRIHDPTARTVYRIIQGKLLVGKKITIREKKGGGGGGKVEKKKKANAKLTHLRCRFRIVLFSTSAPARPVNPYLHFQTQITNRINFQLHLNFIQQCNFRTCQGNCIQNNQSYCC